MKQITISPHAVALLHARRLPARLSADQACVLLGLSLYDIMVLNGKKMLHPLGKPAPNSTKYYAASEIEKLANDVGWLGRATRLLQDHWKTKNQNRPPREATPPSAD